MRYLRAFVPGGSFFFTARVGRNKRSALRRMGIDRTGIVSRVDEASPSGVTLRDAYKVRTDSIERTHYPKPQVVIARAGEFVAIGGAQIVGLVADP
jgi:hypothetical protein